MAELEGRTLGRYVLRQLIGKGGMANVYEAYDPSFQRSVAIKVFKREDEEMLRRFIREADLMASLHHSHLVEVYDTGDYPLDGITRYYIVMPFLTGGTLRMRIRRSRLTLAETCQCLRDICEVLDYIHSQGIVHRDIKASNVLLNAEGRCYLADFGIARITTDATQLTETGNVLGTVDYVAPELFEVHRRADARSDFYSLGVLLYEMVTGRLPFSADNQLALISMHVNKTPPPPRQFAPEVSSEVEKVMYKALSKRPEARYASATELAEAFCKAVSRSGVSLPASASGTNLKTEHGSGPARSRAAVSAESQTLAANPPGARPSPLVSETEGFLRASHGPGNASPDSETQIPVTVPVFPPPRRGLTRKSVAALVLVVLLLLGVPLTYLALTHASGSALRGGPTTGTAQQNASPTQSGTSTTALTAAQATGTANAQASATAAVAPTATARAQASATMGPAATATSGQPVYQDALTSGTSSSVQGAGWDQNSQCIFMSDGYHIFQPASPTYFRGCREQNNNYGNMALATTIEVLSGHSGGIYFRLSTNLLGNYDGYLFEVDSLGNFKISRQQGETITAMHDWSPSPLLHTGYGTKNMLLLVARNNTFQFYANDQFLYQMTDDANYYSASGSTNTIGFLASASQGGSAAEVVYSDLKVYAL